MGEEGGGYQPPIKPGTRAARGAEVGEVGGRGVVQAPDILETERAAERGSKCIVPDEAGVVGRRGAVRIDAIKGRGDTIEVTDNDEGGARGSGKEREKGGGEEVQAVGRLSWSIDGEERQGMRVEGEVEAEDATKGEGVDRGRRGEHNGVIHV